MLGLRSWSRSSAWNYETLLDRKKKLTEFICCATNSNHHMIFDFLRGIYTGGVPYKERTQITVRSNLQIIFRHIPGSFCLLSSNFLDNQKKHTWNVYLSGPLIFFGRAAPKKNRSKTKGVLFSNQNKGQIWVPGCFLTVNPCLSMPAFACCTGVPRLGKKKDHHLCRLVCFWVRKKNTRGKKWEVGVLPLKSQMLQTLQEMKPPNGS